MKRLTDKIYQKDNQTANSRIKQSLPQPDQWLLDRSINEHKKNHTTNTSNDPPSYI
jgi:hypothetical protein